MFDQLAAILLSVIALATVTTLVMQGRQTANVISSGGTAFAKVINAALGKG